MGLRQIAALCALLLALALPARADPTYPDFSAPVVDAANILSDADKAAITRQLFDLQLKTGIQFAVATVPSLDGEEIEPYANGLFRKWRIGQKGVNNGLLLILAPNERKLRFEVGYGLEGSFTDLQSKLILHNTMVPKLKAGDPAGALKAGVNDAILVLTKDKANLPARLKPAESQDMDTATALFVVGFILLFVLIFIVSIVRQVRRHGWSSAASWGTGGFIGGSGFSGDSGGSSGGDSFSGGGGGDSGGGGSSDSY